MVLETGNCYFFSQSRLQCQERSAGSNNEADHHANRLIEVNVAFACGLCEAVVAPICGRQQVILETSQREPNDGDDLFTSVLSDMLKSL